MDHIDRKGLRHVHFQSYNRDMYGILSLLGFGADGEPGGGRGGDIQLNLTPPYQRGVVWGLARRHKLIQSLIEGIPFGAVYLNERDIMEPTNVVDGANRIATFAAFVSGDFSVPAAWWDAEKVFLSDPEIRTRFLDPEGSVGFADLNGLGRRWFMSQQLPTHETKLKTEAEERDLFERINYYGLQQGEVDDDLV